MRSTENKKTSKQQSVSSSKARTQHTKEEYGQEKVNNPNHNRQHAKDCSTRNCSSKTRKSSGK
jgi:hypothetical protein